MEINSKPSFFSRGRYCHVKEFTKIDDWDSIFKHVNGVPPSIYDTAQLIYDKEFLGHKSRYPDIIYIPLYCSLPGFRRCILHVETIEMDQTFIPIEVTYHVNHPISNSIEQIFFNTNNSCIFLTDNEIIHYYTFKNEDCLRRIKRLINETDNFEEFDKSYKLPLSNLFPDPETVVYAKTNIIYCDPDEDPIGFKENEKMWKEIVYPKSSKEGFLQFIFNQINIHRSEQLKLQINQDKQDNVFPLTSCEIFKNQNIHKRHNLANQYISKLSKCLGENEN
jgi:hypothetical protein